jgi:predicted transcriptional regulator
MEKEGGLNESSEADDTYLRNLSTATIIGYIKEDFLNRIPIPHPSLFWILKGALCRLKSYRKYLKLHQRSQKKLEQELDILNVISMRRMMLAFNFG